MRVFFRQFIPLLLMTIFAGGLAGFLRWIVSFIPGMQGLLWGGLLGYAFGIRGRGQTNDNWHPGERFWLWLNLAFTFTATMWISIALLYTPPLTNPMAWLADVAAGSCGEPYFGPVPLNSQEGLLSGGAWIFFNGLDFVFLFFFGLLGMGISATKGERSGPTATGSPVARRVFLIQWSLLSALGIAVAAWDTGETGLRGHDMAGRTQRITTMQGWAGHYIFDDGNRLLNGPGQNGAFVLRIAGYDTLVGTSVPPHEYMFRLTEQGRQWGGRLDRNGSHAIPLRARFHPDGRLQLVGRVHAPGGEVLDLEVEARKAPATN